MKFRWFDRLLLRTTRCCSINSQNINPLLRRTVVAATAATTAVCIGIQAQAHCKSSETKSGFFWGRGKDIQAFDASGFNGKSIKYLSFGESHTAAVCEEGCVWFWDTSKGEQPRILRTKSFVKAVAVGKSRSYALTQEGSLVSWSNDDPTEVKAINLSVLRGWLWNDKIVHLSAFDDNIACVTSSGKAVAKGAGEFGQLGNGKAEDSHDSFQAMMLPQGELATSVAVGKHHTAIITRSGRLLTCGSDATMQLGRKDSAIAWKRNKESADGLCVLTPTPVDLPQELDDKKTRFLSVAAGRNFTAAIALVDEASRRQVLVTFGEGIVGQLGHKSPMHVGRVKVVQGLVGKREWDEVSGTARDLSVIQVACGDDHVIALLSNGAALSWGGNRDMQLGNGGRAAVRGPELIMPLQSHRLEAVFAGANASAAILPRL